ncbi:MAG: NTP transferase domain-containing protein [Candidatus Rokubacteria bacterium]|nr:NTP transferase domain-containing protein [Candidatus Rokubacteria bacterium]
MRALILAAGVGHRMAPLTDRQPKCLLRVGDRPLLERMLDSLAVTPVSEAVIVVGHCQDQIRRVAGHRFGRLPVRYVENPEYTRDSIRSLWVCRDELNATERELDRDGRRRALPNRLSRPPAGVPEPERTADRPGVHRHRRRAEGLRPRGPGPGNRKEGHRAAAARHGRRGGGLLQVRRVPRPRAPGMHRGSPPGSKPIP